MAADPLQVQRKRGAGKPFEKGRSGNPTGRRSGSRNRTTEMLERLLERDAEEIFRGIIEAAKVGDPSAMRICADRLVPTRRGRPVVFPLPKVRTADDVGAAFGTIIEAMSRGELSPEEASAAGAVVELRRRAIETSELEKRIAALETLKEPT